MHGGQIKTEVFLLHIENVLGYFFHAEKKPTSFYVMFIQRQMQQFKRVVVLVEESLYTSHAVNAHVVAIDLRSYVRGFVLVAKYTARVSGDRSDVDFCCHDAVPKAGLK